MPFFFFDVTDDGDAPRPPDEVGTEIPDKKSIPDEAIDLLLNVALDRLSGGVHRMFAVGVRDEEGRVIFKATLSFQAGWQ
jgi:hypothetical protein